MDVIARLPPWMASWTCRGMRAGLLVVAGGVAGELKDLGAQVLEDRGQVDRGAG
eukprot:COSAG06_NODE_68010_length_243_cov_37.201389_1_plen_53_part_01